MNNLNIKITKLLKELDYLKIEQFKNELNEFKNNEQNRDYNKFMFAFNEFYDSLSKIEFLCDCIYNKEKSIDTYSYLLVGSIGIGVGIGIGTIMCLLTK